MQILVNAGANVNAQGGRYGTPLYAASVSGHEKLVQKLVDAGASAQITGLHGCIADMERSSLVAFRSQARYALKIWVSLRALHSHFSDLKLIYIGRTMYLGCNKVYFSTSTKAGERCKNIFPGAVAALPLLEMLQSTPQLLPSTNIKVSNSLQGR